MSDTPLVQNVQNSWDAAAMALEHLAGDLQRAGFQDSITTYETMVRTLILQREWIIANSPDDLHKYNFERVQKAAQEIASILQPYVKLMISLALSGEVIKHDENGERNFAKFESSPVREPVQDNPIIGTFGQSNNESVEVRILEILANGDQTTITRIASQLGIPTRSLKPAIDRLVEKNLIQPVGNTRPYYRKVKF